MGPDWTKPVSDHHLTGASTLNHQLDAKWRLGFISRCFAVFVMIPEPADASWHKLETVVLLLHMINEQNTHVNGTKQALSLCDADLKQWFALALVVTCWMGFSFFDSRVILSTAEWKEREKNTSNLIFYCVCFAFSGIPHFMHVLANKLQITGSLWMISWTSIRLFLFSFPGFQTRHSSF